MDNGDKNPAEEGSANLNETNNYTVTEVAMLMHLILSTMASANEMIKQLRKQVHQSGPLCEEAVKQEFNLITGEVEITSKYDQVKKTMTHTAKSLQKKNPIIMPPARNIIRP